MPETRKRKLNDEAKNRGARRQRRQMRQEKAAKQVMETNGPCPECVNAAGQRGRHAEKKEKEGPKGQRCRGASAASAGPLHPPDLEAWLAECVAHPRALEKARAACRAGRIASVGALAAALAAGDGERLFTAGTYRKLRSREWPCGVCANLNRADYTYCKGCHIAKGALTLDNRWLCGVSDTRVRAAILFRAIARLYKWRREEADNGRAMHWNKTAMMVAAMQPLTTATQVDGLIHVRGIGPATVQLMSEIFLTGGLDYIDDLLLEVRNIPRNRSRESAIASFDAIQERVHRLATVSPEQRRVLRRKRALAFAARLAERRERAREAERHSGSGGSGRGSSDDGSDGEGEGGAVGRAEATIRKGMRLSGAKRRALAKKQQHKQQEAVSSGTRSAAELARLALALRGAEETDVCAICLEVYEDAHALVAFDCRHCFHVECVHQWLDNRIAAGVQPCCPLCRTRIQL